MIGKRIGLTALISMLCFVSCKNSDKTNSEIGTENTLTKVEVKDMKSYISMFEIPATDISRAIGFYEALLDIEIEQMDVEGMRMGILPYKEQMVTGVIIQTEGYKPSADGVTLYLNAGENLQVALNRVEENGGKIILPKTAHADNSGYFAIFLDSEGNKMALNSLK